MAARRLTAALLAVAVAVLGTGCTVTVSGSPQLGTTIPPPDNVPSSTSTSSSTTTSAPSTTAPTTPTRKTSPPPSSWVRTSTTTPTSTSIRPMPPLDTSHVSSTARTTPTGRTTSTARSGDPGSTGHAIAGIDLQGVLGDLRGAHVSVIKSSVNVGKLTDAVDAARSEGLTLFVVSIGRTISNENTSAITQSLFASLGGTVLVLSPSLVSARSDQLTTGQRDTALKAAAAGKSDLQAVTRFIASALKSVGITTTPRRTTTTTSKARVGTVGGVDVDRVLGALGADHIAISKGVGDVTAKDLAAPVTKAWKHHLKLYVAVLGKHATKQPSRVATAIMHRTGGTVVVVSLPLYGISSHRFADKKLNNALDAASKASSYVDLVSKLVNSLLK